MIISSLGEELGLVGLGAILMMFMLLVSRGYRAALGTRVVSVSCWLLACLRSWFCSCSW